MTTAPAPATAEATAATAAMALLSLKFRQRLPARAQALQTAWSAWQADPQGPAPAPLIRDLHSLAGAAGLHGLDALSGGARALEQALLHPQASCTAHAQAFADVLTELGAQAAPTSPE